MHRIAVVIVLLSLLCFQVQCQYVEVLLTSNTDCTGSVNAWAYITIEACIPKSQSSSYIVSITSESSISTTYYSSPNCTGEVSQQIDETIGSCYDNVLGLSQGFGYVQFASVVGVPLPQSSLAMVNNDWTNDDCNGPVLVSTGFSPDFCTQNAEISCDLSENWYATIYDNDQCTGAPVGTFPVPLQTTCTQQFSADNSMFFHGTTSCLNGTLVPTPPPTPSPTPTPTLPPTQPPTLPPTQPPTNPPTLPPTQKPTSKPTLKPTPTPKPTCPPGETGTPPHCVPGFLAGLVNSVTQVVGGLLGLAGEEAGGSAGSTGGVVPRQ